MESVFVAPQSAPTFTIDCPSRGAIYLEPLLATITICMTKCMVFFLKELQLRAISCFLRKPIVYLSIQWGRFTSAVASVLLFDVNLWRKTPEKNTSVILSYCFVPYLMLCDYQSIKHVWLLLLLLLLLLHCCRSKAPHFSHTHIFVLYI